MLKRGMSGNDVRAAMLLMKDKGYYPHTIPASDKLFGPKMEAGVRKMQAEHKLGVDGLIGFNSWTFLLK
jgi:peptidoglycan hydrolase-like protein with peptidoglycan-binding domain